LNDLWIFDIEKEEWDEIIKDENKEEVGEEEKIND
jgi:hypothetical protein